VGSSVAGIGEEVELDEEGEEEDVNEGSDDGDGEGPEAAGSLVQHKHSGYALICLTRAARLLQAMAALKQYNAEVVQLSLRMLQSWHAFLHQGAAVLPAHWVPLLAAFAQSCAEFRHTDQVGAVCCACQ
jgi:hypothetical protein